MLITREDPLDGKIVTGLEVDRDGMDGDQLAFRAGFSDDSQAIFLATIHVDCTPGDLDGNGFASAADAPLLIDALLHPLVTKFDERCAADVNQDGGTDGRDVQAFLEMIFQD